MNYSTEQEDYLMTTPYSKKIQKKFKEVKTFLEKNGFNSSSQGLMPVSYTHLTLPTNREV